LPSAESSAALLLAAQPPALSAQTFEVASIKSSQPGAPRGGFGLSPGGRSTRLHIFVALREQLGLVLESQRGPVRSIVIERAERPTAD
jgi:hypothetical protein